MSKPKVTLFVREDPTQLALRGATLIRGYYVLENSKKKQFVSHIYIQRPLRLECVGGVVECESMNTIYILEQAKNFCEDSGKRFFPALADVEIVHGVVLLIKGRDVQLNRDITGVIVEETEDYYRIDVYGAVRTGESYYLK